MMRCCQKKLIIRISIATLLFTILSLKSGYGWDKKTDIKLREPIQTSYIENIVITEDYIIIPCVNSVVQIPLTNTDCRELVSRPHSIYSVASNDNFFFFVTGAPDWRFIVELNRKISLDNFISKNNDIERVYGTIYHLNENVFLFNQVEYSFNAQSITSGVYYLDIDNEVIEPIIEKDKKIELIDFDPISKTLLYVVEEPSDYTHSYFTYNLDSEQENKINETNLLMARMLNENNIVYQTRNLSGDLRSKNLTTEKDESIFQSKNYFNFFIDHEMRRIIILEMNDSSVLQTVKILYE